MEPFKTPTSKSLKDVNASSGLRAVHNTEIRERYVKAFGFTPCDSIIFHPLRVSSTLSRLSYPSKRAVHDTTPGTILCLIISSQSFSARSVRRHRRNAVRKCPQEASVMIMGLEAVTASARVTRYAPGS